MLRPNENGFVAFGFDTKEVVFDVTFVQPPPCLVECVTLILPPENDTVRLVGEPGGFDEKD